MSMYRKEVLQLYRKIFRVARVWQATSQANTAQERQYIKNEARKLFQKNKNLTDNKEIEMCIEEAQSRIELALHYRIPYPRPVNVAPNFVPASKDKKAQIRRMKQSKPIYTHSQDC